MPLFNYQPVAMYDSPRYTATVIDLLRQGNQSGQIWGRAIENIGNIAANTIQQLQQEREQKKQQALFADAISSYDPADPMAFYQKLAPKIGPKQTLEVINGLQSLQKPQLGPKELEMILRGAKVTLDTVGEEAFVRDYYPHIAQKVRPTLQANGSDVPPPEFAAKYINNWHAQLNPEKTAPVSYEHVATDKGIQPFNKATGELGGVLAQPPAKAEKPTLETFGGAVWERSSTGERTKLGASEGALNRAAAEERRKVEPTDYSQVVRQSPFGGKSYVSANDVSAGEQKALSTWARANGVRYLSKADADSQVALSNAARDLKSAYESAAEKKLFPDSLLGIGANKAAAATQFTEGGQDLKAYNDTISDAAIRLQRAASGGAGMRFQKDLIDKAIKSIPNPMHDIAGTAKKKYDKLMEYLQNVEDAAFSGTSTTMDKTDFFKKHGIE